MTDPNPTATAAEPAIMVSFAVELAMTQSQIEKYAREYSIDADPVTPPVARDVIGRVRDDAQALFDGEYWISSFTTVTVSAPRLRAAVRI